MPGSEAGAVQLARIAGACRRVWNETLDLPQQFHEAAPLAGGGAPRPSFQNLFTALMRRKRAVPWLQELLPARYVPNYQTDAWKAYFEGRCGRPRFRSRDSLTIPRDVRIRDRRLRVPNIGWLALRRRGGDRMGPLSRAS